MIDILSIVLEMKYSLLVLDKCSEKVNILSAAIQINFYLDSILHQFPSDNLHKL